MRNQFENKMFISRIICSAIVLLSAANAMADSSIEPGSIEKCNRNFGTLAVAEPQSQILTYLGSLRLGSAANLVRIVVQESCCFTVVERGVAMQNLQQER